MERNDALTVLATQVPEHCIRFAEELYRLDFDAKAAAEAIGKPGLHKELLADRRVQQAISTIGGELRESFRDLRKQAVWMLATMLTFDPKDVWRGRELLEVGDMPPEARMCIEACEQKADGSIKLKFARRLDILRMFFEVFGDIENTNVAGSSGAVRVIFHGRGSEG